MIDIIAGGERQSMPRGAKILLVGPTGIGKTSQLRTLDLPTTLFADIEAGDLCVQDVAVDTIHIKSWPQARELSTAVHNGDLSPYRTLFIDSLTALSRLSFQHAESQSECISRSGQKDTRAAYGLHARQMLDWLIELQHARATNVILCAVLETVKDDFGRIEHQLQIEGLKTGRELPAIVDQVITYQWVDFGDGKPVRAFVCTQPNPFSYPAKDRSGRLDQIEEPNLGKLITKLTTMKE
jgi:AAA domain